MHLLIVCGEPSGDLNAAGLAKNLLLLNPQLKISAVGGSRLAQAGANIFADIKDLSAIGFFDVLKKLPKFFALKKLVLEKITAEKPDAVILVDFSGFNLRLAKEINKKIPVIYYISPQVWASRPGRVKTIKKYIDKMIVIFKFEQEFYKKYGVETDFVGHPLLDIMAQETGKKESAKTTIALLPGSRRQEVKYILPVMLESSLLISKKINDIRFIIAKSPNVDWDIYNRSIAGMKIDVLVIEGKTYDCLNAADFCLVASGTATLETAIMQRPFAVIYKMNLLNYLLYRPQVKLPFIGMANIVAGKKIVPEFIQFQATPQKIAAETIEILNNPQRIAQIKNGLAEVKNSLGEKGAALRAAQIILKFLSQHRLRIQSTTVC